MSTAVSTARPASGGTVRPVWFLISPYSENVAASARAIHGNPPTPAVSTTTATRPRPTAAHWIGRSRSRSTSTASSTVTIGLM